MDHLDSHSLLSNLQHGFRKERSCETQLASVIQDISSAVGSSQQIDAIILDFSKAFDTVPHQRLLYKLSRYGIRGATLQWIRHFLSDRHQSVVLDGKSSRKVPVVSGVPKAQYLVPSCS